VARFAILSLLLPALAFCESRVTVTSSSVDPGKSDDPALSQIRFLQTVQWDSRQDEYVAPVVDAARKVHADYFRCRLGEKIVTKLAPIKGEPILAARWPQGCGPEVSEVFLWDESWFTTYYLRLRGELLDDPAQLAGVVTDLLWWHDMPGAPHTRVPLRSVAFPIFRDPVSHAAVSRGVPRVAMIPRQFDVGMAASTWLHQDSKFLWLSVSLGKFYLDQYPREMSFVPERFPPLRVRIRNWSTERIRDELGKLDAQGHRSEVLAAELVRRKPGQQEFSSWMKRRNQVSLQILTAAVESGLVSSYRGVLVDLLHNPPTRGAGKDTGPDMISYLHVLRGAPDVNLAPEVLDAWRKNLLGDQAATYLSAKIDSRADAVEFSRLARQRMSADKRRYWLDSALREMEQRFGPLDN
jgi:hypothetical protein